MKPSIDRHQSWVSRCSTYGSCRWVSSSHFNVGRVSPAGETRQAPNTTVTENIGLPGQLAPNSINSAGIVFMASPDASTIENVQTTIPVHKTEASISAIYFPK